MTDDSPRLRAALRYMVYGRDTVFDADRLIGEAAATARAPSCPHA